MTEQAYKEQIDAIKKVSKEARKSRESAIKFLVDAGIIKAKPVSKKKKPTIKSPSKKEINFGIPISINRFS